MYTSVSTIKLGAEMILKEYKDKTLHKYKAVILTFNQNAL